MEIQVVKAGLMEFNYLHLGYRYGGHIVIHKKVDRL